MSELTAAKLAVHRCRARLEFVEERQANRYAVEHARLRLAEAIDALHALEAADD